MKKYNNVPGYFDEETWVKTSCDFLQFFTPFYRYQTNCSCFVGNPEFKVQICGYVCEQHDFFAKEEGYIIIRALQ